MCNQGRLDQALQRRERNEKCTNMLMLMRFASKEGIVIRIVGWRKMVKRAGVKGGEE
jgi:hypothetical protein